MVTLSTIPSKGYLSMHIMSNKTGMFFGNKLNWTQCSICGTSNHSGLWWLGGYNSDVMPPCEISPINKQWQNNASINSEIE
jgi:hypothetical protein